MPTWLGALIIAIIGGSVGTLITMLVNASGDIERHDQWIADRDEDLAQWVADENQSLNQRKGEITLQANAQGVLEGGTLVAGHTAAQVITLHRYRDQETEALRFVTNLAVAEGLPHRLLRRQRNRPIPQLATPAKAQPAISRWREGLTEEVDPTRRTLDRLLEELDTS